MTIIQAYKAQTLSGPPIEPLTLTLLRPFPNVGTYAESQDTMQVEAQRIVTALHDTLPQGTWSQVVAAVAAHWAADQYGIITARAWYPGVSQPTTVPACN